MSTDTLTETPVETPATEPDLWTSTVTDANGTTTTEPAPEVESAPEPEPVPVDETPDQKIEREANGQFTAKKSKRDNPYVRVKDATAETAREREARVAAEARASDLERRLQELETRPAPTPPPQPVPAAGRGRPSEDEVGTTYATYADYVDAVAEWKLEQWQSKQNFQEQIQQQLQAHLETQRMHDALSRHVSTVAESGRTRFADFDTVVNALDVKFSPMHQEAILRAPDSAAVQYALGKNPELARQIAAIDNPFVLGLEFAKLTQSSAAVARPDSASTARPSSAKPPINRVGGAASAVPVDPDDLDFGPDYIRAENERERKRQQANRL